MTNNQSSLCAGLPGWLWWLLTILGLVLLYFLMLFFKQEPIESDLHSRIMDAMNKDNIEWVSVDLEGRGRDVLLRGAAPTADSRDRAIEIAENVHGVRIVEHEIEVRSLAPAKPVVKAPEPEPEPEPEVITEDSVLKVCQTKLDNEMKDKKILFAFNAAEIDIASYPLLDEIVVVLKECRETVATRGLTISGHTDSIGNDSYNMKLSQKRADAVKDYIVNTGVNAGMLKSVGYGESHPVEPNDTTEGRAQNRRIVFTIERS